MIIKFTKLIILKTHIIFITTVLQPEAMRAPGSHPDRQPSGGRSPPGSSGPDAAAPRCAVLPLPIFIWAANNWTSAT